ncbi:hypothetical protein VTI28DRAFT_6251 [Corynascus sepedonium]
MDALGCATRNCTPRVYSTLMHVSTLFRRTTYQQTCFVQFGAKNDRSDFSTRRHCQQGEEATEVLEPMPGRRWKATASTVEVLGETDSSLLTSTPSSISGVQHTICRQRVKRSIESRSNLRTSSPESETPFSKIYLQRCRLEHWSRKREECSGHRTLVQWSAWHSPGCLDPFRS